MSQHKTTDLERSTFQNRPAYRYLRLADHLPNSASDPDPVACVKLFNPTGQGSWYIAAYDPKTRQAYGAADLFEFEYGSIDMEELVTFRGRFGLPIERDLSWTPRPISQCQGT